MEKIEEVSACRPVRGSYMEENLRTKQSGGSYSD